MDFDEVPRRVDEDVVLEAIGARTIRAAVDGDSAAASVQAHVADAAPSVRALIVELHADGDRSSSEGDRIERNACVSVELRVERDGYSSIGITHGIVERGDA